MPRPVILALIDDPAYFRTMIQMMDRLLMPRPVHFQRGEDAILWVAANQCDICIIDYELPDMTGVEALVQMRQRKPRLPVIMTSGASTESVAVAAFRQGILDYLPRSEPDSAQTLVERVANFIKSSDRPDNAPYYQRRAVMVPDDLRQPTYQNRLRVIGRQLDQYHYRTANLVEVAGGFLVRAQRRGIREPEALEFPDSDFPHMVARAFESRNEEPWDRPKSELMLTGYEDFLRTLGRELDQLAAEAVSIAEFDDIAVVGGVAKSEGSQVSQVGPFHLLLRQPDVEYRLNEAFRRRRDVPKQEPRRGLRRFIGGR